MRISDWSSDVCSSDLGDIFAQLHTELIEGVDTHQHRVDERALFVKCDQRTQYFRRYIVEQKCRGWSVAGIGTGRIFIIVPPLHQRRRNQVRMFGIEEWTIGPRANDPDSKSSYATPQIGRAHV